MVESKDLLVLTNLTKLQCHTLQYSENEFKSLSYLRKVVLWDNRDGRICIHPKCELLETAFLPKSKQIRKREENKKKKEQETKQKTKNTEKEKRKSYPRRQKCHKRCPIKTTFKIIASQRNLVVHY